MSNDRDARRLEGLVELFDRFLFCRSFHSKLFPFGDLTQGKDTGFHPSSRLT